MTYIVVAIVGALAGILLDRWWGRYIADCDDLKTIEQRQRERQTFTNLRRWE